MLDTDQNYML